MWTEICRSQHSELGISPEAQLVSAIFGDGKIVLVWDKDANRYVCETQNTPNRPTGSDSKAEDKGGLPKVKLERRDPE